MAVPFDVCAIAIPASQHIHTGRQIFHVKNRLEANIISVFHNAPCQIGQFEAGARVGFIFKKHSNLFVRGIGKTQPGRRLPSFGADRTKTGQVSVNPLKAFADP